MPSALAVRIRHFYQHIQRTRNGMEEERVLDGLPTHYRQQYIFFVRQRVLQKASLSPAVHQTDREV